MTIPDPFAALGLPASPDLDDEQVRAAWRAIAAEHHPDRRGGEDTETYTRASAAYAVLRTPWGRSEAWADLVEARERAQATAPIPLPDPDLADAAEPPRPPDAAGGPRAGRRGARPGRAAPDPRPARRPCGGHRAHHLVPAHRPLRPGAAAAAVTGNPGGRGRGQDRRPAAAAFSAACDGEPVPGIGRICGDLASIQASTTWRADAPSRRAAAATPALPSASCTGAQGRNASCSCSHRSTIDSERRSAALYLFCTETIGTIRCASRSSASVTLETPMWRILPSSFSSDSAPIDSASGTSGSTRWNWYSGIWSSRSRRRLPSQASRRCSGRPSGTQRFGPGRSRPPLVAITRSSGYGYRASAISSSLTAGP